MPVTYGLQAHSHSELQPLCQKVLNKRTRRCIEQKTHKLLFKKTFYLYIYFMNFNQMHI